LEFIGDSKKKPKSGKPPKKTIDPISLEQAKAIKAELGDKEIFPELKRGQ